MTTKQLQILKLFALGYSIRSIALKQNVSISTVRRKLKSLKETPEFENACGIRKCYKQAKKNLCNPLHFSGLRHGIDAITEEHGRVLYIY